MYATNYYYMWKLKIILVGLFLRMPADEVLFVKPHHGADKSEHCWVPHMYYPDIYCDVN